MATLVPTVPTRAGTAVVPPGVSASDVIPPAAIGSRGCIYKVINGGAGADSMTISDASSTLSGAAAAPLVPSVPNGGAQRVFLITPTMADGNGNVTVTHSVVASVTYELYPLG